MKAHLKMLKRIAGRPQDIADIDALEELEKEDEGKSGKEEFLCFSSSTGKNKGISRVFCRRKA